VTPLSSYPSSLESKLFDAVTRADADLFDALALEVFAYQYAHNAPYRRFCDRRSVTPDCLGHWRQIPAVPTSAFKVADLTCHPGRPSTLFLTSGSTQGADRRGRHLVADLALSDTAVLSNAQAHLFPDLSRSGRRILILSLTPPPSERPHSSLIHMIDLLMRRWGTSGSRYLSASNGLDGETLRRVLRCAESEKMPTALFGTTAAFALWFEACADLGWQVALPAGSRLMDTGGRKPAEGAGLPSSPAALNSIDHRDVFLSSAERLLGLPAHAVVNEYGMTELGSQFYMGTRAGEISESSRLTDSAACTDSLLLPRRSVRPPMPPYQEPTGLYTVPSWVRVRLIDPATGEDVPDGETGLLCHYDLANLHSVMAVQTDDLGVRPPGMVGGFYLLGRVAGAEPRGCSLDPSAALLAPR
jgi:acyl-CoA synthetase (AMP-forming)/AMP-acid ligase II